MKVALVRCCYNHNAIFSTFRGYHGDIRAAPPHEKSENVPLRIAIQLPLQHPRLMIMLRMRQRMLLPNCIEEGVYDCMRIYSRERE